MYGPRFLRVTAVVVLSAALVAVAGTAAEAAPLNPQALSSVDTPPVSPSGPTASDPKHFMLNVLGKMLGPLTPNAWKREQIAYTQRYNHDWETLEAQFGQDPANPDYSASPDSYQDYVLKKLETSKKGGTSGSPMTVAATKISKPQKIASGVFNGVSYIAAAETGFAIGKTFSRAIGMNVDGGLCDPGFPDLGLVALVTQTDCTHQGALSDEYKQALHDNPSVIGGLACVPDGSYCIQLMGTGVYGSMGDNTAYCFVWSGALFGPEQHWRPAMQVTPAAGGDMLLDTNPASNEDPNGSTSPINRYACAFAGYPIDHGQYFDPAARAYKPVTPIRYQMTNLWTGETAPSQIAQTADQTPTTIGCSITGDNGQTYSSSTPTYTDASGKTPDPVCPTLPDGVMPMHVTTQANSAAGSKPIQSVDTTPEYQDWYANYPECRDGECKLDLKHSKDGVLGNSCFDDQSVCNGWFTDPAKSDNYACTYGTHTVELAQCAVYSGTFDPSRIAVGAPYSDPMTGEWSGGQSAPTPDTQALGQKIQNPDVARTCNGMQASGFDPVAWVMRPIQCAFEWAFVPRAAVVQLQFENIKTAWSNTGPGKYADAMLAWHIAPDPQGCESTLAFPVPMINKTITVPVIEACPGTPFGDFAGFIRGIVSVTLIVGAGFACKRIISGWVS